MNTSILVVGSYEFLNALPEQILEDLSFNVKVAPSIAEAMSWAQIYLPDILLVQASIPNSEKFCQWIKAQAALTCPYCIFLEDRLNVDRLSSNWEVEQAAAMLESVTDAYVPFFYSGGDEAQQSATNRLILAHIQVGLRNGKKYQELIDKNNSLSAIALADPLTELNNRRAMEKDLPERILQSRATKSPLSLLMLDVDCFKTINDTYGHIVGDRVLQILSYRLRGNLRSPDKLFRYGGEEFVIILSNNDCDRALVIADRLRSVIGDQIFTLDSLSLSVTISIGVACLQNVDDKSGMTLIDRADRCLLQAKAAGRNQVIGCSNQWCETRELAGMV